MSHIFDALQRSEAETSGIDLAALKEATELLERAERRAASQREAGMAGEEVLPVPPASRPAPAGMAPELPASVLAEALHRPSVLALPDRAETFAGFPQLQLSITKQNRLVCFTEPQSLAAEAFRLLGVRLRNLRRERPLTKLLITSTIPQEGKSMVSANLACTLARVTQQKVLLLEGDVRRPALSKVFGLGRHPGICECLRGERTAKSCIYQLEEVGLWLMPSGATPTNPLELLQSPRLPTLLDQLAVWFDWLIIDSPPVLPMADTSVWSRLADGILLIARQGVTEKRALQKGIEALERHKLIGALLNGSNSFLHGGYYYTSNTEPKVEEAALAQSE
jgi:capsular exopolysaccharide synthesis family protein